MRVRLQPEPRVVEWIDAADEESLHLSTLTPGEIRRGLARLPQSKRRSRLEAWLEVELHARLAGRIRAIGAGIADRWGVLALSVIDGWLAATALHHNLPTVTRNVGDFACTPVQVVNPWAS